MVLALLARGAGRTQGVTQKCEQGKGRRDDGDPCRGGQGEGRRQSE